MKRWRPKARREMRRLTAEELQERLATIIEQISAYRP